MKKILTLLCILGSLAGVAQVKQVNNQYGFDFKRLTLREALQLPRVSNGIKDLNGGLDTAQIMYRVADSTVLVHTGYQWIEITGSGAETDPLSFHISDTAAKTWDWADITGAPAFITGYTETDPLSWSLTGNAGTTPGTHFIGTTDNQDLVFKVNNTEAGRLNISTRSVFLGLRNVAFASTGLDNIGIGWFALQDNTTGSDNTAIGQQALADNTTGYYNTAVGQAALQTNTTGFQNTAIGEDALQQMTGGEGNVALGTEVLRLATSGNYNTGGGFRSLYVNAGGSYNAGYGMRTLEDNTTGSYNTAVGFNALGNNTTGSNNIGIGREAGLTLINGHYNIFIGDGAGQNALQKTNARNTIAIGKDSYTTSDSSLVVGTSSLNKTEIYGDSLYFKEAQPGPGVYSLRMDANGKVTYTDTALTFSETDPLSFHISDTAAKTWDWADITGKPAVLSLTTTGTAGPATYSSATGVLNIPNYGSAGANWGGIYAISGETPNLTQTITNTTVWQAFTGSTDGTWTLPALSANMGRVLIIKNSTAFNLTIQRAGSDQIYTNAAVTSFVIGPGKSKEITGHATYWHVSDDGSGAGYTNLTEFVGQTAWRMFYSNGSGDVQELPLGDAGYVLTGAGTTSAPSWELPEAGGTVYPADPQFRLTLSPGTAVTTTDIIGQDTVFYTPYKGNTITLYTGTEWEILQSAEISKQITGLTSGKIYDVYVYNNAGTLDMEFVEWTNDNTRATDLVLQDGVPVKSGATTRRYVGVFKTTSTTTTEDSGGGVTSQVGGKRFLENHYNRVKRFAEVFTSNTGWVYSTAAWRQVEGASGNKVEYVTGEASTLIDAIARGGVYQTSTGASMVGIGISSTTVPSGFRTGNYYGTIKATLSCIYAGTPGLGYFSINWLETGGGGSGTTWDGSYTDGTKAGLRIIIEN